MLDILFNISCFHVFYTQVTNIDGVLENHNDFLDRCLKDCMLTNLELLKVRAIIIFQGFGLYERFYSCLAEKSK